MTDTQFRCEQAYEAEDGNDIAFYMPPRLEPDNCGNYVIQEPTTKNDIRDNRVKDELNRVKDELEPTTKNSLGVDCIDTDICRH